ncbi:hypothetical protein [Nostoc sp.]|uniref:hypothetical protein n=1 Tax=Nostoc sp. TaxID=1180 RepID=UPI002FFA7B9E
MPLEVRQAYEVLNQESGVAKAREQHQGAIALHILKSSRKRQKSLVSQYVQCDG